MENVINDYRTRSIKTPDKIQITFFDNKFHCWDHAAVKYPKEMKKKDEYYLYGFQYTKEDWIEARKDRNGVPPDKNPQVKSRF